ncbi:MULTISPECIES: hypothetical protein [Arenibacter]|nr:MULTISPECIES: hypothetical protein [Arenibacter]
MKAFDNYRRIPTESNKHFFFSQMKYGKRSKWSALRRFTAAF